LPTVCAKADTNSAAHAKPAISPPVTRMAAIFPLICSPEPNLAGETLMGLYDTDVNVVNNWRQCCQIASSVVRRDPGARGLDGVSPFPDRVSP
jgi:hypothetical protein